MKKILNVLTVLSALLVTSNLLVSCDNDPLTVGDELVGGGATGSKYELDIIAYNTTTDTILSNQKVLQNAILGVYNEPTFGQNNARFYTQVRLPSANPTFGKNPSVDSVVLRIPVYHKQKAVKQDTIKVTSGTDDNKKEKWWIKNTFELDSIYGHKEATMRLNVREMNTVLFYDSLYYSNPNLRSKDQLEVLPTVLGSTEISKVVVQNIVKEKDKSTNDFDEEIAYKVVLDKNFFQQKIINNRGTGNLSDNATFIRNVLRGLEISVENDNGFYFQFNPNQIQLKMYYSQDDTSVKEGEEPKRIQLSYDFGFRNRWTPLQTGPDFTVQLNQFSNQRSAELLAATQNPDKVNGASRLYLNGMDGTMINLLFRPEALEDFRNKVKANNWVIVGAKVVMNVDNSYPDITSKPPFIFAWNHYQKEGKWVDEMYSDMTRQQSFVNSYPYNVHFNPMYNFKKNDGQYILDITDHFKSMIERGKVFENQEMRIALGNFLLETGKSNIYSDKPYYNNRVASPHRLVFHGNQSSDQEKKLKLLVYYTQK